MLDEDIEEPIEESKEDQAEESPIAESKERDWDTIDLSKGPIKGAKLYNTRRVRKTLKDNLRPVLRDASLRGEVADMILSKRKGGLNRIELKKGLRKMRDERKLSDSQMRRVRRKFGI